MTAGTELFAERGFDGTSVERIAHRAGVNKAMINYHFGGKRKLYVAILSATFTEMASRLGPLRGSSQPAESLLREFVSTFAGMVASRPAIPHILLREILSGGRHVDEHLLPHFLAVFSIVREIVERGVRDGSFRPVHPFLAHLTLIGSLVFFFVTAPVRERVAGAGKLPVPQPSPEEFVRHVQELMARGLAAEPSQNA